jgi:hypothetical protein
MRIKMHHGFNKLHNSVEFVDIKQYETYVGKIRSFTIYNRKFYMMKNFLCIGKKTQHLIPLDYNDNKNTIIMNESYIYNHSFETKYSAWQSEIHNLTENEIEYIDDAIPLFPMWSSNFWHWIFESLPKILLLEKYNYSGIYIVPNEKFVIEIINILHIDKNRVKFPAKNYIIKNIIICENHMFRAYELKDNLPIVNIIRDTLLDNVGIENGKKFSYIKRIKSRYILNEEEFLHVIHKYDFDVFIPEEHTVKQQIRYMTNVVASIMPHGANTTLTLFQPLKSKFIECFGFAYVNYTNRHIIKLLKLLYIPIPEMVDSSTLNSATSLTNTKNIVVDIELLKVILKNILKK